MRLISNKLQKMDQNGAKEWFSSAFYFTGLKLLSKFADFMS
jgi:hypothetical protein